MPRLLIAIEIIKFYGSHATKQGLIHHFVRDLNPNVNLLKESVPKGGDPKDVTLVEGVRDGKNGKGQTRGAFICPYHTCIYPLVSKFFLSESPY